MAIEVFGAGAVQSAYVSYVPLNITANSITLIWPTSYVNAPYIDPVTQIHYDVLAASMEVTTADPNVHTVTLPDATQSSVGSNFIITNVGLKSFNLLRSDSTILQVIDIIPNSNSYWVQLTDNSTSAGVWSVVTFGAGTSNASANELAGNGLTAIGAKLNTNTPIFEANVVPAIDDTLRAKLILWTGGSATLPLPKVAGAGSVPAGYYVSFNNEGSAQITIQPAIDELLVVTIDRSPNIVVQVGQSLTIISDGANWWTLGFGQNQFTAASSLILDVSAGVNVTLTNTQAAYLIQNYTQALGANITVFFPVTTNYWFINNETTGGGTLSVQLAGPLGTAYVIPKETKQIFYSNGFSMFPIPTSLSLDVPLSIASGGTNANTQSTAATNILPPAADGSLLYWDQMLNAWVTLPIGASVANNTLTLVDVGAGRLLPRWV